MASAYLLCSASFLALDHSQTSNWSAYCLFVSLRAGAPIFAARIESKLIKLQVCYSTAMVVRSLCAGFLAAPHFAKD